MLALRMPLPVATGSASAATTLFGWPPALPGRRVADAIPWCQLDFEFNDLVPHRIAALAFGNRQQFAKTSLQILARGLGRGALLDWLDWRFVLVAHHSIMTQSASIGDRTTIQVWLSPRRSSLLPWCR